MAPLVQSRENDMQWEELTTLLNKDYTQETRRRVNHGCHGNLRCVNRCKETQLEFLVEGKVVLRLGPGSCTARQGTPSLSYPYPVIFDVYCEIESYCHPAHTELNL